MLTDETPKVVKIFVSYSTVTAIWSLLNADTVASMANPKPANFNDLRELEIGGVSEYVGSLKFALKVAEPDLDTFELNITFLRPRAPFDVDDKSNETFREEGVKDNS